MPKHIEIRNNVYKAIDTEREYQGKWDKAESEGNHTPLEFIAYMEDYLAEAKHIQSRGAAEAVHTETMNIIRKVTALGVSCMEQHGAPYRKA